ncbi:MAG: serine hydrolase [Stigonema ocellatum SAG 48.90 = DSM 106950]|nr:serine hydrolase [Stigonema ocellatum SAG 48.90 = DSM 106950]
MYQHNISFLVTILLTTNLLFPQLAVADARLQTQLKAEIPVQATSIMPKAALERLFTSEQIQSEWFAPEFLAQIPIEKVRKIIAELKSQLLSYKAVQNNDQDYLVIFTQGSVPTKIVLNSKGQISGLLFHPPQGKIASLEDAIAQFKALPGQVSVLVREGKTTKAALNPETPLAVGSAFKLAVLKVLKSEIISGKRTWKDVVQLGSSMKSLPSGMLQKWPDGSYLTVQTLAALMISISDNTATDTLINLIGRQAIESVSPRNRPFLTTREVSVLKAQENRDLLKRYQTSNETQRRAILKGLTKKPLPNVSDFKDVNPVALDVEWFFTADRRKAEGRRQKAEGKKNFLSALCHRV